MKEAGQKAAANVAQAAGHNQVHGSPLNFISRNTQYGGLHSTENAVAKFTTGVVTSTTNADERERASGEQPRITGFGKHVGNLLETLQTIPHCGKIATKIGNKWSTDKRVRQEETSWRHNGASARSVMSNLDKMDDVMEVGDLKLTTRTRATRDVMSDVNPPAQANHRR